ncbi:MAG: hypothetical protein JF588_03610 [Caulobacterales bacterium]|nr:hypothetical protein [Caulobacterales bacterium]
MDMKPHPADRRAELGQSYFVLRHGGASAERASAELGLACASGRTQEALFQVRRPGKGGDPMRPRFARHDRHVAATRAAGGFPALPL